MQYSSIAAMNKNLLSVIVCSGGLFVFCCVVICFEWSNQQNNMMMVSR
jgi:hypothetical protein